MKIFHSISILVITAFFLGACGAVAPVASQQPPLRVSWITWPGFYPLLIAQENGLFEKHGVQVELLQMDNSRSQQIQLASDEADGALLVLTDVVLSASTNDLRITFITDSSNGGDQLVASQDTASVADLRGKRIGVLLGSYSELFVREMLKQNGMTKRDVQMINVLPEELPAALGVTVDAGHTFEPFTSAARDKGYKVVFSTTSAPDLILDVMAFRGSVVDERPQDVRAFTAAWFEAVAWWQANPDEAATMIAQLTGQNPEDISTEGLRLYTQADNLDAFDTNQTNSVYETAQKNLDFYTTIGGLNAVPDLTILLDPSYLQ